AEADHQHVARDAEIFHGRGQHEAVGRHHADVGYAVDEAFGREFLGIDHGAVDIGEYLELAADARVIAVGGQAVGDDALAILLFDERLDHAAGLRHLANPLIRHDRHEALPRAFG